MDAACGTEGSPATIDAVAVILLRAEKQHPLRVDAEKVKEKKRTLQELSMISTASRINPGQRAAITLAISEILRTTREHIAVGSAK